MIDNLKSEHLKRAAEEFRSLQFNNGLFVMPCAWDSFSAVLFEKLGFQCIGTTSPHFSPGGEMIAQRFGFTRHFLRKWNNSVYFRLKKKSCGFKDQARARQSGVKWGLVVA